MNRPEKTIRAFIAVELSDDTKKEIERIEKLLKKSDIDAAWVDHSKAHITLKFLGNISVSKIDIISRSLSKITPIIRPFIFSLKDIGAFPDIDRIRVVWLGVGNGGDSLTDLAGTVEEEMAKQGIKKESYKFTPHITVGRVKSDKNIKLLKNIVQSIAVTSVNTEVTRIVLFESALKSEGSVYTPLRTFDLVGTA